MVLFPWFYRVQALLAESPPCTSPPRADASKAATIIVDPKAAMRIIRTAGRRKRDGRGDLAVGRERAPSSDMQHPTTLVPQFFSIVAADAASQNQSQPDYVNPESQ